MSFKIVDNVLPEHIANDIFSVLSSGSFPWFFTPAVVYENNFNNGQYMSHVIYEDNMIKSKYYEILQPLLEIINPRSLVRAKANLYLVADKVVEHGFHVDYNWDDIKTAVYYVNSNDGYTKMEDGTKIQSVKNRLATLNPLVSHTSSTCTTGVRITLNFNWF